MAGNDPFAYLTPEEILQIRLDEQYSAAKYRHADYDEVIDRAKDWTDDQKREAFNQDMLYNGSGDYAEHVYQTIREKTDFKPVTDEQLYPDGDGDPPDYSEKHPRMSDEAIFGE